MFVKERSAHVRRELNEHDFSKLQVTLSKQYKSLPTDEVQTYKEKAQDHFKNEKIRFISVENAEVYDERPSQ
jgi:hypothetical protein